MNYLFPIGFSSISPVLRGREHQVQTNFSMQILFWATESTYKDSRRGSGRMGGGICKSVIRINQLLLAHLFFFIMASVCLNGYEFFFFFRRIVTCSHRYGLLALVVIRMISCYSTGTFFAFFPFRNLLVAVDFSPV